MMIGSEDNRDQSWKLSEIAPNFGRFFSPCQILGGGPSKNGTHIITGASRHVVWKSFVRILQLVQKLQLQGRTRHKYLISKIKNLA